MHHLPASLFRCRHLRIVAPALAALFPLSPVFAQQADLRASPLIARASPALADLPEAPSLSSSSSAAEPLGASSQPLPQIANQKEGSQPSLNPLQRRATPYVPTSTDITIAPGQAGPRQTVSDKLFGSVRDSISPFSIAGEVISAGYSQGIDSSPHYGRDLGAFGQRVGASVARGTSQKLFSEGVMAAVLHEDPRYYQLGSKQNFFKRVLYAGTRPVIGRTDGGRTTPNLALLSGYLGASALAQVYYPARDQGFGDVMRTWGTGVGGAAIGDEVSEFLPDVLQFLHLKRVDHR